MAAGTTDNSTDTEALSLHTGVKGTPFAAMVDGALVVFALVAVDGLDGAESDIIL